MLQHQIPESGQLWVLETDCNSSQTSDWVYWRTWSKNKYANESEVKSSLAQGGLASVDTRLEPDALLCEEEVNSALITVYEILENTFRTVKQPTTICNQALPNVPCSETILNEM